MAKFVWIGVGVLLLGAAACAYVLNNGAPPIPKGGCPAAVSLAPYDSDIVAYVDFASLRSAVPQQQLDALTHSPSAAALNQFVAATNFHFESDLDHITLVASTSSSSGALVFDGRFDQAKLVDFFTKSGARMDHYETADVYLFPSPSPAGSFSVAFFGPNRVAITGGKDSETQMLVLADAVRHPNSSSHEGLCARTSRVSGAPFFLLGEVSKTSAIRTALARSADHGVTDVLSGIQGWDMGFWAEGDSVRLAFEGEYDGALDALKARFALQKLLDTAHKEMANAGLSMNSSQRAVLDTFWKKFAVTVDGHYLRVGTSLNRSDMLSLASVATPNFSSMGRQ